MIVDPSPDALATLVRHPQIAYHPQAFRPAAFL
jgi:hypothetical protein